MKISEELIIEKLKILSNKKLSSLGRAGSMLWIGFGETILKENFRGEIRKVKEYVLHISCSWRLADEWKIIVASRDMYIPKLGIPDEDFDSDVLGNSRFDEKVSRLLQDIETNSTYVSEFVVDKYGGLIIRFINGLKLEVFPDDSLEEEYWRFFTNITRSEHLVVFKED
jgi:hypothetical protein